MRTWKQELEEALEKEETVVRALLVQASLKTPALQVGNIAELDAIVNREQPLVIQLQNIQDARERLLSQNGLSGKTLREIIEQTPDGWEQLSRRRDTLKTAASKLQSLNRQNNAIARSHLEQYDRLVKSLKPSQAIYTNSGAASDSKAGQTFIDQKI